MQIQFLGTRALVPFKAELHVVRRHGLAVVKLEPTPQLEFVGEAIRALRPRLRQTVAHLLSRQRTHQRVVQRIQDAERCDLRRSRRGIEPARGDGDRPGHDSLSCRERLAAHLAGCSKRDHDKRQERHDTTYEPACHRHIHTLFSFVSVARGSDYAFPRDSLLPLARMGGWLAGGER